LASSVIKIKNFGKDIIFKILNSSASYSLFLISFLLDFFLLKTTTSFASIINATASLYKGKILSIVI
jgi:hypothetical protein